MQRRRGGLVPISEALDDLPGPDQALHPPPKARRSFTMADQVNQLVGASEADPGSWFGVAPIWWTPENLGERSPQWEGINTRTRLSIGHGWWNWCGPGGHRRNWAESSSRVDGGRCRVRCERSSCCYCPPIHSAVKG